MQIQLVILINFILEAHIIAVTIKHLAIRERRTTNNKNNILN